MKHIIDRLKQNKENTPEYSAFSENNHDAIDAMIITLEQNLTTADIYKKFNTPHEQDAALAILEVANGEIDIEDVLYPEK